MSTRTADGPGSIWRLPKTQEFARLLRVLMNTLRVGILTSENPTETSGDQSHCFLDVGCPGQDGVFLGPKDRCEGRRESIAENNGARPSRLANRTNAR